jgi:hypothetical protein
VPESLHGVGPTDPPPATASRPVPAVGRDDTDDHTNQFSVGDPVLGKRACWQPNAQPASSNPAT